MLKKIFYIPKSIRALLIFSVVLATVRILVFRTATSNYIYWNLFLALIPLFISSLIFYLGDKNKLSKISLIGCMILWLLFLPNAFYIVTDLIHVGRIRIVPDMFDIVLVFSGALSGLILGMVSVFKIEEILEKFYSKKLVNFMIMFSILFASFGVYIGRFLRFNSWDIFTDGVFLVKSIREIFLSPVVFLAAFLYTALFFAFFYTLYITFKRLQIKW